MSTIFLKNKGREEVEVSIQEVTKKCNMTEVGIGAVALKSPGHPTEI